MNILLQAPGLLILLILANGTQETVICLAICASVQLLLGLPFLTTFPWAYIQRSFDLGRVFTYKWTVNLKFLSEEIFVSHNLSIILLIATIVSMILFIWKIIISVSVLLLNDIISFV